MIVGFPAPSQFVLAHHHHYKHGLPGMQADAALAFSEAVFGSAGQPAASIGLGRDHQELTELRRERVEIEPTGHE